VAIAPLRDIDFRELALSLKNDAPAVRARVDANLSTRMRAILADELAYMGPVRLGDIEAVQNQIAVHFRKLLRMGEVTL
jgi:flagellar motor switch protein FliG